MHQQINLILILLSDLTMLRGKKRSDGELHAESEAVFKDYGFTDNSGICPWNFEVLIQAK